MKNGFPILLLMAAAFWNCAQQGSPSGGPRDEDPPVVMESEPPNYSTRFDARRIEITFDEYIVLDNVNQELVVSPPMEENPEVRLRKKTLIIEFEEELKSQTTYTFNFGSAIKDLHEGNKLQNFEYVFSTGEVLDSLSVKGTLSYAKDLSVPDEPIAIMLYEDLRDSVPLLDLPLYIGRSNDSGLFSVNNLKPGEYKVFALKDGNNNFLFDLPTEEIAFLDSSLTLNAEFARALLLEEGHAEPDTAGEMKFPADSAEVYADTSGLAMDTLVEKGPDFNAVYIDLLLFTQENEIQYITNEARDERRRIDLIFARPLTDSFRYRFLTAPGEGEVETLEVFSPRRDTLALWITDSSDYRKDTLIMELKYTVTDTAGRYITQVDTLDFRYREVKKRRDEEPEQEETLTVSTIRNNGQQDLNRDIVLDVNFPIGAIRDSLIRLYQIPDSVEIAAAFKVVADSLQPTRVRLQADWESAVRYRMELLPGAIGSIYGVDHDTVDVSFTTRDAEYYGRILLSLEGVQGRVIADLLNKDQRVRRQTVNSDGDYAFGFLHPQEYRIRFIQDWNGNGEWNTGDYLEKRQPEPVEFVPKAITVRSNWDHEVSYRLEK